MEPQLVHDGAADMFCLRHIYLMIVGLCTLTNHMQVEVYGRSAGTHTAISLIAHLAELNK